MQAGEVRQTLQMIGEPLQFAKNALATAASLTPTAADRVVVASQLDGIQHMVRVAQMQLAMATAGVDAFTAALRQAAEDNSA